jgi:hypothetical protein
VTIENGQPRHRQHYAQETERLELQQITQRRKQMYYEKTTALTLFYTTTTIVSMFFSQTRHIFHMRISDLLLKLYVFLYCFYKSYFPLSREKCRHLCRVQLVNVLVTIN